MNLQNLLSSILFFVSVIITIPSSAAWQALSSATERPIAAKVVESTNSKTVLEYEIFGFNIDETVINNQVYQRISIPGALSLDNKGLPELPKISQDVLLPVGAQPTFKVVASEESTVQVGRLVPSRGVITRNINPQDVPYAFSALYESDSSFPAQRLLAGTVFNFRDVQGVNIQVRPFIYNFAKKSLQVTRKIRIEISHATRTEQLFSDKRKMNPAFEELYQNHFINFQNLRSSRAFKDQPLIRDSGRAMIIAPKAWNSALQGFVKWKTQRGLDVVQVNKEDISPANHLGIAALIKKDYSANALSYVILVGDAEIIATHPGKTDGAKGAEADPIYAQVDGSDDYPDLFISRISVKNTKELDVVLAKLIAYEQNPEVNGDWYSRGIGIASDQGDWSGLKDFERADLLRDLMLKWHYKEVAQIYDPSANVRDVADIINRGVGYINYIGHGSENQWVSSGFSNSDIEALTNGNKLPFIVSVACVNGHFAYGSGDSFAEKWLKAGSVQDPKGAIAILASSINQAWVEPTVGQKRISELLTSEKLSTIGGLFFQGTTAVLESKMEASKETFETWHIFGDATLQVRTKAPTAVNLGQILSGMDKDVDLDLKEKALSVTAFYKGVRIGKGISAENGHAKLTFTQAIPAGETIEFFVTGFNKVPLTHSHRVQ